MKSYQHEWRSNMAITMMGTWQSNMQFTGGNHAHVVPCYRSLASSHGPRL
jgi:hypothetical protein